MRRLAKLLPISLLVLCLPVLLAACGGVPGNAVAVVEGESIEKSDFDEWVQVAARAGGQTDAAVPQPPDFAECVAQRREAQPEPAEGEEPVSDEQLREQCRQEYQAIRDAVMQQLINAEWIEREAEQQDVEVTDQQVRESFEQQKDQQFQREAQYERFLRESGYTEDQLLQQVRTAELARGITEKVTADVGEVTDADVRSFYQENRERFAQPESRDVRVVLARSRARAEQAREALEDGDSWRTVARRFSTDETSRTQGGLLEGVTRGSQDAGLEDAVFGAQEGELVGPVRTSLGYYVLEVTDVTEPEQQSLEEVSEVIRQQLEQQRSQEALQEFEREYVEEWREQTECRDGYEVPQFCGNVEEPEPTPTPAVPGTPPAATPEPTPGEE